MTNPNPNQDQEDFWSKKPGLIWSQNDHVLDATLAPVLEHLLERTDLRPGEHVLDVGCGTGLSTIKAARAVGPEGHATGVDIADQMLVKARQQSEGLSNATFTRADAQVHDFPGDSFDVVISRFGVMFFADPSVAFANIARALKSGGRMVFICWASAQENPWFEVPRSVAIDRLGPVEPTPPNAPGPMGLADPSYIKKVFTDAGLDGVEVTPVSMDLTPFGSAHDMGGFALTLGPASRIFADLEGTDEDAVAIADGIARHFQQYETADGLRIPAVLNRIEIKC